LLRLFVVWRSGQSVSFAFGRNRSTVSTVSVAKHVEAYGHCCSERKKLSDERHIWIMHGVFILQHMHTAVIIIHFLNTLSFGIEKPFT
jgi:hypothetical protein